MSQNDDRARRLSKGTIVKPIVVGLFASVSGVLAEHSNISRHLAYVVTDPRMKQIMHARADDFYIMTIFFAVGSLLMLASFIIDEITPLERRLRQGMTETSFMCFWVSAAYLAFGLLLYVTELFLEQTRFSADHLYIVSVFPRIWEVGSACLIGGVCVAVFAIGLSIHEFISPLSTPTVVKAASSSPSRPLVDRKPSNQKKSIQAKKARTPKDSHRPKR